LQTIQQPRQIIHNRLLEAGLSPNRFHGLQPKTKVAYYGFKESHKTAIELDSYPSIGVNVGDGLVIVDFDEDGYEDAHNHFNDTFTVKSGGKGKPHYYLKVVGDQGEFDSSKKLVFGDLKLKNGYCVAPGSHINYYDETKGKRIVGDYTILKDAPIKEMVLTDLMAELKPYFKHEGKGEDRLTLEQITKGVNKGERHTVGIRYVNYLIGVQKLDPQTALTEMQRWNKTCNPPNDEAEIKQMVRDAANYQKAHPKTNNENGDTSKYIQKETKAEPDMGFALQMLNSKFMFKCPTDSRELYIYENGVYKLGECQVHALLEEEYDKDLKKHFLDEVTGHLERSNYVEREEINQFANKIPVQNGLFNFVTREVEPFDPDKIFTYKLNVTCNPKKECPKFLKFVKEIMPDENDRLLLQEICGYCLVPAMPFHKLFWLYGIGRNGKDRIVLTLEHILGKDNCAHLNLGDLSEGRRFSLCQLYGKLLNISSEPNTKYPITTNILKLISGENTIHAELKGKNKRLRFTNISKPIVVGNNFPKVNDTSIGFWERVVVLNFPRTFTGEECIPNIERQWLEDPEEVSGIFNWMLQGAYRLKEKGQFTTSKTTEETKTEFMKVSDPFNAWIAECCKFVPDAYLTRSEAYNDYKDYADEIGATPDSARIFYAKMRQTPRVKDTRTKVNDKIERVFQGVTLKTEEDTIEEEKQQQTPDPLTSLTCLTSFPIQEKNETKKNDIEKPVKNVKTVNNSIEPLDIDQYFPDGQYPICFVCRKPVSYPNDLTNIDGLPCHAMCKRTVMAQRKEDA